MKLLINTASTFKGGGVQVAHSFIEECTHFIEHEYHVILGETLAEIIDTNEFPSNFNFYPIDYRPATRVFSFKPRVKYFNQIEKKINPDVVFTTSGPSYWRPEVPHLVGYNLPHYIYKDSPYFDKIPFYKRLKWYVKGELLKYFFNRDSDLFVVQTEDVNRRLRTWLKTDRVSTVSNTFNRYYNNPKPVSAKLPPKQPNEFRFITLSAWYPHKNIDIIPRVINALPKRLKGNVKFIITLPETDFKEYFPQGSLGSIVNVGPVKPEEGPSLYKECDALFLPTLLECFSASYAEAMAMEKPIITTELGFAKSICGDSALYYRPVDPLDAAKKIELLVDNPQLQKELVANGERQLLKFDTPRERAQKYLELCKKLLQ